MMIDETSVGETECGLGDSPSSLAVVEPSQQWTEKRLVQSLGVSRRILREARAQCAEGTDWGMTSKGEVYWTEAGFKKVVAMLEVPEPTLPTVETLTVVSAPVFPNGSHLANPRLIRARRANGEVITVRVAVAGRFRPRLPDGSPMTFDAERSQYGWVQITRPVRQAKP